jgi:hypothetical protein
MNAPVTSPAISTSPTPCEIVLIRLLNYPGSLPNRKECQQIAAEIGHPEDGAKYAYLARRIATTLCQSADKSSRQMGIVLFKELAKAGDYSALVEHAWLCWKDGPLKNHQHALELVEAAMSHIWPDWTPADRKYAHAMLGQAFRLKGMLLLHGEKIRRNPGQALTHIKWAADQYLDGQAALLAANCHARNTAPGYAHVVKNHAQAHDWYMQRAREHGAAPVDATVCNEVQP